MLGNCAKRSRLPLAAGLPAWASEMRGRGCPTLLHSPITSQPWRPPPARPPGSACASRTLAWSVRGSSRRSAQAGHGILALLPAGGRQCGLWPSGARGAGRPAAALQGPPAGALSPPRPAPGPLQEELVMWRNPRNSAIALGAATAVFAFLQFAKVNAIQTGAYALLTAVLGCFLWNNLASFTHRCDGALPDGGARGAAPRRRWDAAAASTSRARMHADRLRYRCRRPRRRPPAPQGARARAAAAQGGRERGASQGRGGARLGADQQGPGCVGVWRAAPRQPAHARLCCAPMALLRRCAAAWSVLQRTACSLRHNACWLAPHSPPSAPAPLPQPWRTAWPRGASRC